MIGEQCTTRSKLETAWLLVRALVGAVGLAVFGFFSPRERQWLRENAKRADEARDRREREVSNG